MPTSSDRELIERAVAGDRKAFRGIVEKHQAFGRSLSYRFVGNTADADDITQEAFIRLRRGDPLTESVQRVVPVSLYQCLQACQTMKGDCIPCKIKYARINKHYENI